MRGACLQCCILGHGFPSCRHQTGSAHPGWPPQILCSLRCLLGSSVSSTPQGCCCLVCLRDSGAGLRGSCQGRPVVCSSGCERPSTLHSLSPALGSAAGSLCHVRCRPALQACCSEGARQMIPGSAPAPQAAGCTAPRHRARRGQGLRSPLQQGSGTAGLCCGGAQHQQEPAPGSASSSQRSASSLPSPSACGGGILSRWEGIACCRRAFRVGPSAVPAALAVHPDPSLLPVPARRCLPPAVVGEFCIGT